MTDTPVLEVRNLNIRFDTPKGEFHAVKDVSFDVRAGEILCIAGIDGNGQGGDALQAVMNPGQQLPEGFGTGPINRLWIGILPVSSDSGAPFGGCGIGAALR